MAEHGSTQHVNSFSSRANVPVHGNLVIASYRIVSWSNVPWCPQLPEGSSNSSRLVMSIRNFAYLVESDELLPKLASKSWSNKLHELGRECSEGEATGTMSCLMLLRSARDISWNKFQLYMVKSLWMSIGCEHSGVVWACSCLAKCPNTATSPALDLFHHYQRQDDEQWQYSADKRNPNKRETICSVSRQSGKDVACDQPNSWLMWAAAGGPTCDEDICWSRCGQVSIHRVY